MQFVFVCGFTQFFWIMMYSDPFDQWWIWRGSQLVLQPVLGKILQVTKRHAGHELHQNGPISEDWARFKDCYTIWKVEFRCITCMHGYGKPSSNSQSSFYIGNSWLDEPLTANQSEAITIDPEKNFHGKALSSDSELWPHMDFGFIPEDAVSLSRWKWRRYGCGHCCQQM